MTTGNILLMGLPESGKTTYLAAFWHFIESGEISGALRLNGLQDDREYLNRIRSRWQDCHTMERTESDAKNYIRIPLQNQQKQNMDLIFPDLSGEAYRQLWTQRQMSADLNRFIQNTTGILLFVHPDKLNEPKTIRDILPEQNPNAETQNVTKEIPETPTPFDPEKCPTDVQLVDLLQIIAEIAKPITKVAILISAYDLLEKSEIKTPTAFFEKKLPLLKQFLDSNPEHYLSTIFGVSAQGGDFENKEIVEKLKDEYQTSKRIRVYSAKEKEPNSDITRPVQWLLTQDE